MEDKKVLHDILRWASIGKIVNILARQLDIPPVEALRRFYLSETRRRLADRSTGLYLYGNLYIVDEYLRETGEKI